MKKIVVLAIYFLTGFGYMQAQQNFSPEQRSVNEAVIAVFDALANRDSVSLKMHCTADILILEDAAVWNLDTLTTSIRRNTDPEFKRVNSIEFIETKLEGKTAWTSYYNQARITRKGKQFTIRWLETAILVKENKKWKMRVLHSTFIERK